MDKIVALCKRRGFVFPSSEVYGGLSATWDYGPMGVELKRNLEAIWWRSMVTQRDDIVGLDAAIMMHPRTWEASGHLENFSDPLVDCRKCKTRYRSDHLDAQVLAQKRCPSCGGELTDPRFFNLMFSTQLGSITEEALSVYLRPETAQGIFVNFKNVTDSSRVRIPFGIAQVGKAFRNEITTRNFIFRTCEFEQMEMQYFIEPGSEGEWFQYWKKNRLAWYHEKIGIRDNFLRYHEHSADELAHYAAEALDIQYCYPHGWEEMEGIHSRTDYDLRRHSEFSGRELSYQDPLTNKRYIPYVIETSIGLTRLVLISLLDAYDEEVLANGEQRVVLRLHPNVAPYRCAVLPLLKKDGLPQQAQKIKEQLIEENISLFYDQQGSIGRRYRRMDEIGVPFCLTIDHQSLEDKTVTLRYRDSMEQHRVAAHDLVSLIRKESTHYQRR